LETLRVINPSTRAARWRKIKKLIAADEPETLLSAMEPGDWALGWERGEGLLLAALEAQSARCALALLERAEPAEISRADARGATPLAVALENAKGLGEEVAARFLAAAPQALTALDGNGCGPIEKAARAGAWSQFTALARASLRLPAPERERALRGASASEPGALSLAVRFDAPAEALDAAIEASAPLSPTELLFALREAAWRGRDGAVRALASRFRAGELIACAALGQSEEEKLARGAPPPWPARPVVEIVPAPDPFSDSSDEEPPTPLLMPAAKASPEERAPGDDAEPAAPDMASVFASPEHAKRSPLLIAFFRGHEAAARALLDAGFSAGDIDATGRNALHAAIWARSLPLMRLAIAAGASARLADEHGFTPALLCATRFCEPAAFRLLRARRVSFGGSTKRGHSALELACWGGTLAGVRWLLRRKAGLSRLSVSSMGPFEAALRSAIDPVEKAQALLAEPGVAPAMADPELFVKLSDIRSTIEKAPRDWSAAHPGEALRHPEGRRPSAARRALTLATAVASSQKTLSWCLSPEGLGGRWGHFDFFAAWLRAVDAGKRQALLAVERAWALHAEREPLFCSAQDRERCLREAAEAFGVASFDAESVSWEKEPPAAFRGTAALGRSIWPLGVPLPPETFLVWAGAVFLSTSFGAVRARLARRADWDACGLWGPSAHDARKQRSFFAQSGQRSLAQEIAKMFDRAGRAELRAHLAAAERSGSPVSALWLFAQGAALADLAGTTKKSRRLAARDALASVRARLGAAAGWADALPAFLRSEGFAFEARLTPERKAEWVEAGRHQSGPPDARAFEADLWGSACQRLDASWLRELREAGLPGRADPSALASALRCANAWRRARPSLRDAQTRHALDEALRDAFEQIAQAPAAEPSFRSVDTRGRGALFHCFAEEAWRVALEHGAPLLLEAPGSARPDAEPERDLGGSALTALLASHSLDRLPASVFRLASEARSPWGASLLVQREPDGMLPFALGLRGSNLPQEAQRRLASLWPPTLREAQPSEEEQSALLARALSFGLFRVAETMLEHGARLPGGGAFVCAVRRLKTQGERVLLGEAGSALKTSGAALAPERWAESRLGAMVRWHRERGADPFEPLPAPGRFDVVESLALPGFDPLICAIIERQLDVAHALLRAGHPVGRTADLALLPKKRLEQWLGDKTQATRPLAERLREGKGAKLDAVGFLCLEHGARSWGEELFGSLLEALAKAGARFGEDPGPDGFSPSSFLGGRPASLARLEALALAELRAARPAAPVRPRSVRL
jgi:hypothetical protein